MPEKQLNYAILGVDKFSAVFDKLFGKLSKAATDTAAATKHATKNLPDVANAMERIGGHARTAVDAVSNLVPGLAAVSAIGSGAGLAMFVKTTAGAAAETKRVAEQLGIATDQLQAFESVSRSVGGDAGGMRAGMRSLNKALIDAGWGHNAEAAGWAGTFGISIEQMKNGAFDTKEVLLQLADTYRDLFRNPKSGPEGAGALLSSFGVRDLAPMMGLGRGEIEKRMEEFRRSGAAFTQGQTENAAAFEHATKRLGDAISGVSNRIADTFIPAATSAADATADWLTNINAVGAALERPGLSGAKKKAIEREGASQFGLGWASDAAGWWASNIFDNAFGTDLASYVPGYMKAPERRGRGVMPTGIGGDKSLRDLAGDRQSLLGAARLNPIETPAMRDVKSQVDIRVMFENAPPGTRAVVNTNHPGNTEVFMPTDGP